MAISIPTNSVRNALVVMLQLDVIVPKTAPVIGPICKNEYKLWVKKAKQEMTKKSYKRRDKHRGDDCDGAVRCQACCGYN